MSKNTSKNSQTGVPKPAMSETLAVKRYLDALEVKRTHEKPRWRDPEMRIQIVEGSLASDNLTNIERLCLLQERADLKDHLNDSSGDSFAEALDGFREHGLSFSQRKGIKYSTWREMGVPSQDLKEAGIYP